MSPMEAIKQPNRPEIGRKRLVMDIMHNCCPMQKIVPAMNRRRLNEFKGEPQPEREDMRVLNGHGNGNGKDIGYDLFDGVGVLGSERYRGCKARMTDSSGTPTMELGHV